MRYPPSHKLATRRRIVAAASAAFREQGVAETGLDDVMRRAGLTHGGFYSHFSDKSELIAEACADAFEAAVPNLDRIASLPTAAQRARLLIDSYLAVRHRDNRGAGCLLVAVGADMARLRGSARAAYTQGFRRHLDRLCAALRLDERPEENRERVLRLLSSLVGALLLARAIDDETASAAMLASIRRQLRDEFCRESSTRATSRPTRSGGFLPSHDFFLSV